MGTELWVPDIGRALRELLEAIPPGRVTTYRALAEALGDPEVAGFISHWLSSPEAAGLPSHRVVHASGAVGRAPGGTAEEAAAKLRAEGIRVVGLRVDPLARYFLADLPGARPLARLQEEQRAIAQAVVLSPLPEVRALGALDVAYRGEEGVAALVLADGSGEVLDQLTVEFPVKFPYIRTYLAYRELPGYLRAVEAAGRMGWDFDVLLVDGNGVLHPRGAGVASHLGVLLDRPAVGVAKGHLCGHVNTEGMAIGEWRPVVMGEETVGAAIRTDRNRTLFVSPGHRCDLGSAVELAQRLTEASPLPAPLAWAHDLATEAAGTSE